MWRKISQRDLRTILRSLHTLSRKQHKACSGCQKATRQRNTRLRSYCEHGLVDHLALWEMRFNLLPVMSLVLVLLYDVTKDGCAVLKRTMANTEKCIKPFCEPCMTTPSN